MTTPEQARELASLLDDAPYECGCTMESADALRDLARQVEELQANAERYRWLRRGGYTHQFATSVLNDTPFGIDESIDKARRAK